jgi:hypothetical protein
MPELMVAASLQLVAGRYAIAALITKYLYAEITTPTIVGVVNFVICSSAIALHSNRCLDVRLRVVIADLEVVELILEDAGRLTLDL